MSERIRVAIVYGSGREGRLCDRLVDWVRERMAMQAAFDMALIDPRVHLLGGSGPASGESGLSALREEVFRADAFIVVTPEYNHGYPAALKEIIDAAYREWHAKVAAFVSYGGTSGGIRAVEQLRQVFAELHVATVRDGVSFPHAWERIGADGRFAATPSQEKAFARMTAQLLWWARALRDARLAAPYEETVQ
ncbi:NADPH-dependent FMN reductase [Noviherbaspirillum aridicola]|uniref:FMN reductase n=1 Tax=Noviherbaspirillum aridicola TaxID=2849687 RepID=A0ABQ4PZB2_9BURK|nr:NAD(P)H-dependent oxidoreductase [Noviherbaspirillum aridicola]GIZ50165.1 FMN reductase [Noviherbaspirillum aridicola]